MTISFVCSIYPRKLILHLQKIRNYKVLEREKGIYDIIGDKIPIQIILTKELLADYSRHKDNILYKSIMDIIVRANREKFREAKDMCDALLELMQDELDEKKAEGERIGKELGKELGKEIGSNRVNRLILKLSETGRSDEIIKAASDTSYQKQLFEEFGL